MMIMGVCNEHLNSYPYFTRRCQHRGNRFVVQIQNVENNFTFVDYVEQQPDGDVIVESGDPETEEDVNVIWLDLVGKLQNNVSPNDAG